MVLLITAAALVAWLVLAWFIGSLLGLHGAELWMLRGSLALLGVAGAAVFLWIYFKNRQPAGPALEAGAPGAEDIDLLIRDAEAKLAAARLEQGGRLGSLPAIFLIGESGSSKTSIFVHSGLEPELLAGQVYQNNNVVPTASANLWFARRAIFVEAGGKLLGDAGRWGRLIRRMQPNKFGSVMGQGEQAPRAALVCFDSEVFTRGGDAAVAVARNLRARLGEISQLLGINLPVYVLFTKSDRLPFFADFVRNLSNEEAGQVLGATVPMRASSAGGVYGEEESARLSAAFDDLFRSLAAARPELLVRENDANKLPGVYEFPREFRKLRSPLVQFLVDLCRPSQLTVGPFLRGFYFTGVRPVIVQEVAPVASPRAAEPQGGEGPSGATGIFHVGPRAQQAPQAAAPQIVGTRKVPQWLFLGHLFHDVLLADRVALGASGASTKTGFLRRLLLVSAAVICLVLSVGFLISWARNRSLESSAIAAARGISSAESTGLALPSVDALRRLDTLRESLATLTLYNRAGAPWSYRWGLYVGNDLYPEIRRIYFEKFRQLLFGQTQAGLLEYLRALPVTPGPAYGPSYDALKGYLITTSHHDKSTREFLAPLLMARWSANRTVDPERTQLAQKQFEFYSEELKAENPYSSQNDGAAIEKARRYLRQFAGAERVYQFMLAEAGKNNPPVNFNKQFAGSAEFVVDSRDVAGAFTKGGWAFMKNALQNVDKYFAGEQWVLGDAGAAGAVDRAKLEQQIRELYYADFIAQWRAYLKAASVVKYASLKDAAAKLNTLSGNQSPLLALFWLASQHTAVDAPDVAAAFQPVHTVVPSSSVDRYIAPTNQNYMNALVTLQASLDGIANQPGQPPEAAANQTLGQATQAKVTTRQLAQAFRIDPQAHIEGTVQSLLEQPITYVEALLRTLGPAELNAKGKGLCAQFSALMRKYPFNPNATAEATLQEFNGVMRKPDGALWAFYEANLQKLLPRQGAQFTPVQAGGVTLNPAFVAFFTQAAAVSESLYAGGAQDPHLTYTLKPVPSEGIQTVGLRLDGQTLSYSGGAATPKQFTWQGGGPHEARATVKFGGGPDLAWSNNEGVWAVFRFFDKAERWQPAGTGHSLEWIIRIGKDPVTLPSGKPLTVRFDLDMAGAPPVFQKGWLGRLGCVSEVAKP